MNSSQPNVIIILTDDQGYGDLGCHGNPVADTPSLDALHACSSRLSDFHVAPMCTPTRGQLMTGLDAARNGAMNVSSGRTMIRADLPTMADYFHEAGYHTGLFGKWHLGDNYPFRPQDRGFEETLWFPSSHISSLPDYWENDYFDDVYVHNGERKRMEGYCTEVFFREARHWMQHCIDNRNPFFAYLPTNAPHYPWWVPKHDHEAMEAYFTAHEDQLGDYDHDQRASMIRFLAMIRNLDREIGELRGFLDEAGVAEDTIFIFMTDNGSTFGPAYYNAGMRGGKCTLWEGGHRVPCFINWPKGGLNTERDVDGLTHVQDILPTLRDWCGLQLGEQELDGCSLDSVLRGDDRVDPDRMICVNYSRMPQCDYPTPAAGSVMRREGAGVLWQRWRLIEGTALYHLDEDPLQEHNVFDDHPEIADKMIDGLDRWWDEVKDTANQPQRIIIGDDAENPAMLSACEWWDVFLDQQNQVRHGCHKNSYWHLDVACAGRYLFTLQRWPVEAELPLDAGSPATTITDGALPAGTALPIASARIHIGSHDQRCECTEGDHAAVFELELDAGETLLHTWFFDQRGEPICGAYYVYVERLN